MGRTVLINAVLDGHLSYIMMSVALPPGVIAKIDKRRGMENQLVPTA